MATDQIRCVNWANEPKAEQALKELGLAHNEFTDGGKLRLFSLAEMLYDKGMNVALIYVKTQPHCHLLCVDTKNFSNR